VACTRVRPLDRDQDAVRAPHGVPVHPVVEVRRRLGLEVDRHRLAPVLDVADARVGAALLTEDYTIFAGCNVENSSYGLAICAERNAVFKAVCAGQTKYKAIAIVSDDKNFLPPCGACRQVLFEFAPDMELILTNAKGEIKTSSLGRLFPMPADLKMLGKRPSNK